MVTYRMPPCSISSSTRATPLGTPCTRQRRLAFTVQRTGGGIGRCSVPAYPPCRCWVCGSRRTAECSARPLTVAGPERSIRDDGARRCSGPPCHRVDGKCLGTPCDSLNGRRREEEMSVKRASTGKDKR